MASPPAQSPTPTDQLHPDHDGLQVVQAKEDGSAPELVTAHNKPSTPYSDGPEVYDAQHTAPYYAPPEKVSDYEYNHSQGLHPVHGEGAYDSTFQQQQQQQEQQQQQQGPAGYPYSASGYQPVSTAERDNSSDPEGNVFMKDAIVTANYKRRICGMPRRGFFWLVGVIVAVIVLGAVLGGVLGSVLGGSSSNSSSSSTPASNTTSGPSFPSIYSGTGLAFESETGTSTAYSYYQDPSGRIIENVFANGEWSVQGSDVPNDAIVTTDARRGSPIAATTYKQDKDLIVRMTIEPQLATANRSAIGC